LKNIIHEKFKKQIEKIENAFEIKELPEFLAKIKINFMNGETIEKTRKTKFALDIESI